MENKDKTTDTNRLERKFLLKGVQSRDVENFLSRLNPRVVKIFPDRRVNNIYFDTYSMRDFYQHLNGLIFRKKYRLRWYGDSNSIFNSQIEVKKKSGNIILKDILNIGDFPDALTNPGDFKISLLKSIENSDIKANLSERIPVLINSYNRAYFSTYARDIRLTIDYDIKFAGIKRANSFPPLRKSNGIILEVKYNQSQESRVNSLLKNFPFQLGRNSKYLNGISQY